MSDASLISGVFERPVASFRAVDELWVQYDTSFFNPSDPSPPWADVITLSPAGAIQVASIDVSPFVDGSFRGLTTVPSPRASVDTRGLIAAMSTTSTSSAPYTNATQIMRVNADATVDYGSIYVDDDGTVFNEFYNAGIGALVASGGGPVAFKLRALAVNDDLSLSPLSSWTNFDYGPFNPSGGVGFGSVPDGRFFYTSAKFSSAIPAVAGFIDPIGGGYDTDLTGLFGATIAPSGGTGFDNSFVGLDMGDAASFETGADAFIVSDNLRMLDKIHVTWGATFMVTDQLGRGYLWDTGAGNLYATSTGKFVKIASSLRNSDGSGFDTALFYAATGMSADGLSLYGRTQNPTQYEYWPITPPALPLLNNLAAGPTRPQSPHRW